MKKILYIVTMPDWGGAQRYVFDSAISLKNDYNVIVSFGAREGASKIDLGEKCRAAGIATHRFKNLVRSINPVKDLAAVFEIKNYLETEKPDTVYLNSSKAGIVGSLSAALSAYKPEVVYVVHGWIFLEPMAAWKKRFYIFLERLASRWRNKIVVLGEKEKQVALKYKICPEKKIEIGRHTISAPDFLDKTEATKILGLTAGKKIIGTIANFYPSKGLEYLAEAAAMTDAKAIFAVIGDGPERHNLELKIKKLKLENKFILLGEKENAVKYLKAFDIFVLPSVKEGAPYVILEAMAAGLPIIAADVGNVSEMLQNYHDKIIIHPRNIPLLAEAISEKIRN